MTTVIKNATVITPGEFIMDGAVAISDGYVVGLGTTREITLEFTGKRVVDADGSYLTPGLIDVQVNGGGGHTFSASASASASVERESYEEILTAHASFGTTSVCPTITTGPIESMVDAISLCATFQNSLSSASAEVVGIHVEGPFLSTNKRGGHAEEYLLRPSVDIAKLLLEAARGQLAIFTLAPELAGSADVIELLSGQGVLVSVGHSSATAEEANAAFRLGARGVTHLYNAMEGMTSRMPGTVGAALARGDIFAGLIADLLHVDPVSVAVALNARGTARTYLTTDAVCPIAWTDGGCYAGAGVLPGIAKPLAHMVRNLVDRIGITFQDAVKMATEVPAEMLGLADRRGAILPGRRADLVLWSRDLNPQSVWIGGHEIHSTPKAADGGFLPMNEAFETFVND